MAEIAFYRLSRKVVNNEQSIPEAARQVMFYSLAIGHHVGVMDCFDQMMAVPEGQYSRVVSLLPDGEARRKLEGALKWQEIEINRSHVDALLHELDGLLPALGIEDAAWIGKLVASLHEIVTEPVLYLMVKRIE